MVVMVLHLDLQESGSEMKYDTYYNLSVGDIQAHPHSDTIYFNKATPPNMDTPFDLMGFNYI